MTRNKLCIANGAWKRAHCVCTFIISQAIVSILVSDPRTDADSRKITSMSISWMPILKECWEWVLDRLIFLTILFPWYVYVYIDGTCVHVSEIHILARSWRARVPGRIPKDDIDLRFGRPAWFIQRHESSAHCAQLICYRSTIGRIQPIRILRV